MMAPESACKRGGITSLSYIPSFMGCVSACFRLKIKVQTWKVKPGNRFIKIKWINLICLWKLAFETRATGSRPRWHWIYGKLATLPPTLPKPPSRDCSSDPLGRFHRVLIYLASFQEPWKRSHWPSDFTCSALCSDVAANVLKFHELMWSVGTISIMLLPLLAYWGTEIIYFSPWSCDRVSVLSCRLSGSI